MIGYRRQDYELAVCKIPERKKPVILLRRGNKESVIGQCRTMEDAEIIMTAISAIVIGNEEDYAKVDRYIDGGSE